MTNPHATRPLTVGLLATTAEADLGPDGWALALIRETHPDQRFATHILTYDDVDAVADMLRAQGIPALVESDPGAPFWTDRDRVLVTGSPVQGDIRIASGTQQFDGWPTTLPRLLGSGERTLTTRFDHVIHHRDADQKNWRELREPVAGAVEAAHALLAAGWTVSINTQRQEQLDDITTWCITHGIPAVRDDGSSTAPPGRVLVTGAILPAAHRLEVGDRALDPSMGLTVVHDRLTAAHTALVDRLTGAAAPTATRPEREAILDRLRAAEQVCIAARAQFAAVREELRALDAGQGRPAPAWCYAIGVDFDGVLRPHTRDGRLDGPPVDGAIEGLRTLMDRWAVFVFTTHDAEGKAAWLVEQGIPAIVDTDPEASHWGTKGTVLVTHRKKSAVAYIDDRAIPFMGWQQTLRETETLY